jgi:hypothetical protein
VPLVVAAACAHTPQLLVRPPTEDRDLVLRPLDHAFFVPLRISSSTGSFSSG